MLITQNYNEKMLGKLGSLSLTTEIRQNSRKNTSKFFPKTSLLRTRNPVDASFCYPENQENRVASFSCSCTLSRFGNYIAR